MNEIQKNRVAGLLKGRLVLWRAYISRMLRIADIATIIVNGHVFRESMNGLNEGFVSIGGLHIELFIISSMFVI